MVNGIYKKLIVGDDGKRLLGAILVGDATEYSSLLPLAKTGAPLPVSPDELLFGSRSGGSYRPSGGMRGGGRRR